MNTMTQYVRKDMNLKQNRALSELSQLVFLANHHMKLFLSATAEQNWKEADEQWRLYVRNGEDALKARWAIEQYAGEGEQKYK